MQTLGITSSLKKTAMGIFRMIFQITRHFALLYHSPVLIHPTVSSSSSSILTLFWNNLNLDPVSISVILLLFLPPSLPLTAAFVLLRTRPLSDTGLNNDKFSTVNHQRRGLTPVLCYELTLTTSVCGHVYCYSPIRPCLPSTAPSFFPSPPSSWLRRKIDH